MPKYKVWRKTIVTEYKTVEADSAEEAEAHHIDPYEGFTIEDKGQILKWWVEPIQIERIKE